MKIKLYDLVVCRFNEFPNLIGVVVSFGNTTGYYNVIPVGYDRFLTTLEIPSNEFYYIYVERKHILKVLYHDYFIPDPDCDDLMELREKVQKLEKENTRLLNNVNNNNIEKLQLIAFKDSLRKFLEIKEPIYEECPF